MKMWSPSAVGKTAIYRAVAALAILSVGLLDAAEVVPEGITSSALSAAFAEAQSGDTVRLAEGTYALTEPLRVPSGRKVVGAGQEKTRLTYTGTNPVTLVSLDGCEDVELAHLTIDGDNNPLVHQGIGGGDARRLWVHHVTIRRLKAKTFGPHGMLFGGTRPTPKNPAGRPGMTDSRITHCTLEEIGLDAEFGGGIRLAFGCDRNEVSDNRIDRTGRGGIFGDGAAELVVRRNRVTGSGGEGLGIELWGGCPRSVIEDNDVDHWISIDAGGQTAVRRNTVHAADGSAKFCGIEIIARDVVVSDNIVDGGAMIGLSVSNRPVKNNVLWARNTVRDCVQWGAQFQGESGGIAHHFFYGCQFETTRKGDSRALYAGADGHGFRANGHCRGIVFEDCVFRSNGGYGVQVGGPEVDVLSFRNCSFIDNAAGPGTPPDALARAEFLHCTLATQGKSQPLPDVRPFSNAGPEAAFESPMRITVGQPAAFRCASKASATSGAVGAAGGIVDRLWDFGHGIPAMAAEPSVTFETPGIKRVTLVVWDTEGRGSLIEKQVPVEP